MRSRRLSREEALSFLLTHIVVERSQTFEMNPATLFSLTSLAAEAEDLVNREEGVIPHEVIETIASRFLEGDNR